MNNVFDILYIFESNSQINILSQMCSVPLDLFSMLEKNPGNEHITDAMRALNKKHSQNALLPSYATLGRSGGARGMSKSRASTIALGSKSNAVDARKMYNEVNMISRYCAVRARTQNFI